MFEDNEISFHSLENMDAQLVTMATFLLLLYDVAMATRSSERHSSRTHALPQIFRRPYPYGRPLLNWAGRRPLPIRTKPHSIPYGAKPNLPVVPTTPKPKPIKPKPIKPNPIKPKPIIDPKPTVEPNNDPADLSNLFGHCSQDPGVNVHSIFSGMFLSPTDLNEMVLESQAEIQPEVFSTFKKTERYIEENRFQETIGTIQGMAAPAADTCCETKLVVTAPGKVMVEGQSMSVVHMNHSYQYVQEGICENPSARCRDIGLCSQIYKYAFLLLYDPQLMGKVNPPVRYGRVQIKSHCECMNVGAPLKK